MASFDSPILRCEHCRHIVLTDTTWQDCARAHHCQVGECPYKNYFIHREPTAAEENITAKPDKSGPAD